MQNSINNIVNHWFRKESLEQVPEEQLREFVESHPYAGIGHLLLAKKLQLSESPSFPEKAAGSVIYFNNPLWHYQVLSGPEVPEPEETGAPVVVDSAYLVKEPEVREHAVSPAAPIPPAAVAESPVPEAPAPPPVEDTAAPAREEIPAPTPDQAMPQPEPATAPAAPQEGKDIINEEKEVFEPYHTIDYFASQGIKLQQEDLLKDHLGLQLKSFTEWLRSMKRLPQAPVSAPVLDEAASASIRRFATDSIEEHDILTEAMAEVWVKQGNFPKAIAIYEKLSLQNPGKSTYFAGKIEYLKDK